MGTSIGKKTAKKVKELLEQNSGEPIEQRIRIAAKAVDYSKYVGVVGGVGGVASACLKGVQDVREGNFGNLEISSVPQDEFEASSVAGQILDSCFGSGDLDDLVESALRVAMVNGLMSDSHDEAEFLMVFCLEFLRRVLRAELWEGALAVDTGYDVDTLTGSLTDTLEVIATEVVEGVEFATLMSRLRQGDTDPVEFFKDFAAMISTRKED